jgi:serine acetyltransferase
MRAIPKNQVVAMSMVGWVWFGGASGLTAGARILGIGRGWADTLLIFVAAWIVAGLLLYRGLLKRFPLRAGPRAAGSTEEFRFNVFHLPFCFFLLSPLANSGIIPTPLTRLFFILFGARIGENTYPGRCMIFDPIFVTLGRNVVLGHQAMLVPHVLEGDVLSLHPIRIADDATIGVNAVVLAGVTVGEGAVVAAGAVVSKFTRIGPREIWGGIPAKRIGVCGELPTSSSPLAISLSRK